MNKSEYLLKRKQMVSEAEALLSASNVKDANAKMAEVKALDAKFEESAKAQADFDALNNVVVLPPTVPGATSAIGNGPIDMTGISKTFTPEAADYTDVFAKLLMGKDLNDVEAQEFTRVNNAAYTHTVKDQGVLIPETVVAGIMGLVSKQYPFFGEIRKMNVKGNVTFKKHTAITAGDAAFIDEAAVATDEKNTFVEITLKGFELAKLVRVSFKLEAMSIPEFNAYIQAEIADRIGRVLGTTVFSGNGTTAPTGVLTELAATGTDQIVTTAVKDVVGYADLTMLRSKIASQFSNGLKFYANSTMIWNQLANIVDGNKQPVFVREPVDGGVGTIFGVPVVEDDGVPNNELVLGNPSAAMVSNTNEPLSIQSQKELGKRETVFLGYTIIDWTVTYVEAFAHLKVKLV